MNYDPEVHHRRSIRLRGYDYAQPGTYFVTMCSHRRECLFGEVVDGEIRLNDMGEMIERWWLELAKKFQSVEIDEYVVMPNHFYGIISLVGPTHVFARVNAGLEQRAHTQVRPYRRWSDGSKPCPRTNTYAGSKIVAGHLLRAECGSATTTNTLSATTRN